MIIDLIFDVAAGRPGIPGSVAKVRFGPVL